MQIKPLKFQELEGISRDQLEQHHDVLYAGYVKKIGEIQEQLASAKTDGANGTYSELGELMRQQSFAYNGVSLHEWYFENLTSGGTEPSADIKSAIEARWGNWDSFITIFKAAGLAARGWVVLAYSAFDGELQLFAQDAHDKGAAWASMPLLIMDVYEHAYMIDYGVKRKDYIEAFFKNVDWQVVSKRFATVRDWKLN